MRYLLLIRCGGWVQAQTANFIEIISRDGMKSRMPCEHEKPDDVLQSLPAKSKTSYSMNAMATRNVTISSPHSDLRGLLAMNYLYASHAPLWWQYASRMK